VGGVSVIFEDKNASIWVSTDRGLFHYNRNYWTYYEPDSDIEYISKDFLQDRIDGVWITLEYFQDVKEDMGFSIVSGKLQLYKNNIWFKFDSDVAGSAAVKGRDPETYFTSMLQDSKGRIWFSSLEGIFVFNGKKWTSYKKDDLDAKKVYHLIEDHKGIFWAATEHGVSKKLALRWENYSKKDGLADNSAYKIVEDQFGRKWAFSQNDVRFSGLSLYEDGNWRAFNIGDLQLRGEVEELIFHQDEVLAFSKFGVAKFKNGTWIKFDNEAGLLDKNYSKIKKDRGEDIWLAGDQGFYTYKEGKWELLIWLEDKWEVNKICRDKKHQIWIGTEKSGVFVYSNGTWEKYDEEKGLADNNISDIFEDRNGVIWVITKKGISKISTLLLSN
jgi:ligand-binding sensor domain-containing protein